jgi:hypothetical protein
MFRRSTVPHINKYSLDREKKITRKKGNFLNQNSFGSFSRRASTERRMTKKVLLEADPNEF